MEEVNIVQNIVEHVDIMYILTCNIITYIIISILQSAREAKIKKWIKRTISASVGVLLALLMVLGFKHNAETVFYSFFIQFLTWDYVIKELKEKFKQ